MMETALKKILTTKQIPIEKPDYQNLFREKTLFRAHACVLVYIGIKSIRTYLKIGGGYAATSQVR